MICDKCGAAPASDKNFTKGGGILCDDCLPLTVEKLSVKIEKLSSKEKTNLLKAVVFALWVELGENDDEQTVDPDKKWNADTLEEIADQVTSYGIRPTRNTDNLRR